MCIWCWVTYSEKYFLKKMIFLCLFIPILVYKMLFIYFNYLRFTYIILIFSTWSEVYVFFIYIIFRVFLQYFFSEYVLGNCTHLLFKVYIVLVI